MHGFDLLGELLSRKTVEEIASICDYWKSDSHLEIEELLKVPIFRSTLSLQTCTYGEATKQRFYDLLQDMEDASSDHSVIAIITRPPEIVACLKTRIADRDVYVIFDSHPRPTHPDGLGFIINSSIKMATAYLSNLLSFDENILKDPSLQWQAQLLGYFSGHILLPLEEEPSTIEILLESSMALLSSYADVASEKARVSELREKVEELERQHRHMEERAKHLERRRREEYEQHQKTIRSYEREREKSQGRTSSRSGHHLSHPPSISPPPCHPPRIKPPPLLSKMAKDDKGKGRMQPAPSQGSSFNGPQNRSYASITSDTRRGSSLPKNTALFGQESTMPGGFLDPDAAVSDLDRDIAIAMELQREFEVENQQLRNQREMLQGMISIAFECSICFDEYSQDSVTRVEGCEHSFCRDCLRGHAKAKISERRFPIFCPLCTTDRNKIEHGVVDENVIQQIGISEEDYKIFEELQITSFCVPLHCRGCAHTMFVDRQELQETKIISCPWPGCQFVWCKACQQQIEVGGPQHSCDGSSELRHLMQQQGWKTCPGCSTPVQKSEGCNHMTCITPACNTHFCYIDGGMIIKGGIRKEIQDALNAHYRKCKLFDYK
ncbi:hypothetical protein D9756_002246 [Leucocoprinus leucothites]|uniref:Uncharacterized protein n=1 Tax=Leucocoprinus leucothites TaxID=201217 RepID=A0A8H5GC63_9AGAR|nr:hypothetical protein D9756_002246 [Leucoagaricus leucothites]